jgi:hypothetical protein
MGTLLNRRRYMGGKALPYDAEIEYLESTGTQYIDTGIACASYDGVKAKLQANGERLSENAYIFFGQGISYSSSNFELYTARMYPGISFCLAGNTDVAIDYTKIFSVNVENKIATYTDESGQVIGVANRSQKGDYTAAFTMAICALHRSSYFKTTHNVRCFNFQIIQSSIVVMDLIPVRVGQTGYMYDKVSGQLFGNAGTGDFVLGPDKT